MLLLQWQLLGAVGAAMVLVRRPAVEAGSKEPGHAWAATPAWAPVHSSETVTLSPALNVSQSEHSSDALHWPAKVSKLSSCPFLQLLPGARGAAGPGAAALVREASGRGGGPVRMATPALAPTLRTSSATAMSPARVNVRTTGPGWRTVG